MVISDDGVSVPPENPCKRTLESDGEEEDIGTVNMLQLFNPRSQVRPLKHLSLDKSPRCDECACIYLSQDDYYKHIKNFHNGGVKKRVKKMCKTCVDGCGAQCPGKNETVMKDRGNNNLFHYNIKDRWCKMLSKKLATTNVPQTKLEPEVVIKAEPEDSRIDIESGIFIKAEPEEPEEDHPYYLSDEEPAAQHTLSGDHLSMLFGQVESQIKQETGEEDSKKRDEEEIVLPLPLVEDIKEEPQDEYDVGEIVLFSD